MDFKTKVDITAYLLERFEDEVKDIENLDYQKGYIQAVKNIQRYEDSLK